MPAWSRVGSDFESFWGWKLCQVGSKIQENRRRLGNFDKNNVDCGHKYQGVKHLTNPGNHKNEDFGTSRKVNKTRGLHFWFTDTCDFATFPLSLVAPAMKVCSSRLMHYGKDRVRLQTKDFPYPPQRRLRTGGHGASLGHEAWAISTKLITDEFMDYWF